MILWADTFNNYFHPHVAQAAVEVLEHAGYQVWVPQASLCCGRPLYDFGMLDDAKKVLLDILHTSAATNRGRHPGDRPGTELPLRLPRRDD